MFYLNVPDEDVPILDVEDSALARLEHFAAFTKFSDEPKRVEYLQTSTALDYAGFLCLRTHASLFNNPTLKEMIIEGECRLFTERLNLIKPNLLRKNLVKTIEDIGLLSLTDDTIDIILKVCLILKNKQHEPCNEQCNSNYIEVPWQKCPTLVSNRNVHLINGIAIVPCYRWNSLLVDLFRIIYIKSLYCIRRSMSSLAEKNLQIEYLSDKINDYYNSKVAFWKNTNEPISIEKLNLNKQLLPPCMLLSLNLLYRNHRLAHDPRYRLTLFLKEVGVPLDQTLMLFKQEYSKCGNSGSTCTHNWEEHSKKIEYNVQHTYGHLGSKIKYQMTSCATIQKQNIQITDEGCCPFVHFSKNKLQNILEEGSLISDVEMNIINELKNSDQPIRACHWYAHKLFQTPKNECHRTPAEYFFCAKKALIRSDYE